MAVALEIIPFSSSLDMYGDPDRSAAYSLSGHVNITLSSSGSFFERRKAAHLILQSLVITFEGQTELMSEEMGYSALRLCTISKELVPEEWIELNSDDVDESSDTCSWSVVFNLAVPGWLPASSPFGDREGGNNYALYASAMIRDNDAAPSRTWLSTLCTPFSNQSRTVKAPRLLVTLNRYITPSLYASSSTTPFPTVHYEVSAQPEELAESSKFPRDVISKIRVQASVPKCIDLEDEKIPFSVRLRTNGLPEAECKRLRVTDFHVDVEQGEKYRTRPFSAYMSQFPVPPKEQQPPQQPLLRPHPLHVLYDSSARPKQENILSRSFSLLPPNSLGHYLIAGDGYIFTRDVTELDNTWFSLASEVPLATTATPESLDWKASRRTRTSSMSPFLSVYHRMYVTLTCSYDLTEGPHPERVTERLRFHVPLVFVRVPPKAPECSRSPSPTLLGHVRSVSALSAETVATLVDLPAASAPYAGTLPPYSQLFYANGDRKIDYSVPLPLYTPRDDTDAADEAIL